MQAVIVSLLLYKALEVHWNHYLATDGSALADGEGGKNLRRKSTLTDRKQVNPLPLNTLHRKSTLNRRLCSARSWWKTSVRKLAPALGHFRMLAVCVPRA